MLYCTNNDVDKENNNCLENLPGESMVFTCKDEWEQVPSVASYKKWILETADKVYVNCLL